MDQATELLRTEFERRKIRNPQFSLRAFAKWLDISPAQLSQLIGGKRPMTLKTFLKIGKRLGLSPMEGREYLQSLVELNSDNLKLTTNTFLNLTEDKFRLISDWYHLAILSLSHLKDAQADPRWIARNLGISLENTNQAILRLKRLGLLKTKPRLEQVGDFISVSSEVPSEAIRKYHKQNLDLAHEKIDSVPIEFRDFQSISIPMNTKNLKKLKKMIGQFLDQANSHTDKKNANQVYHLNVQLFPVTKLSEEPHEI